MRYHRTIIAEVGAEVIEVEVMSDHVHLLAEIAPAVPMSRFIGLVRGRSSRVPRLKFPRLRRLPVLWSRRGLCPRSVARRWRSYAAMWRTRRRWCEVRQ